MGSAEERGSSLMVLVVFGWRELSVGKDTTRRRTSAPSCCSFPIILLALQSSTTLHHGLLLGQHLWNRARQGQLLLLLQGQSTKSAESERMSLLLTRLASRPSLSNRLELVATAIDVRGNIQSQPSHRLSWYQMSTTTLAIRILTAT